MQRLWVTDGNRKWAVFLFNWSSHYHICLVKYRFSGREDYFGNLGETSVLVCERFTQRAAQNSFQHFPRRRFWLVIPTTLYRLMPNSWYQNTTQSLVNMLLSILWHNSLINIATIWPAKNTLNFSLKLLYLKNELGDPHFLLSNNMQLFAKLRKFSGVGTEPPQIFENLQWLWTRSTEFCKKIHPIVFITIGK